MVVVSLIWGLSMKTVVQGWRNQQFKLVIDEPGVPSNKRSVLAVAELYEGLSVWTITDVRLAQHGKASPHFSVGAEHFWASWSANDEDELRRVRSNLREFFPQKPGGELDLYWCTFDGIVRGKTPAEMGVAAHLNNPAPVLHTLQEVRAYFSQLKAFWADWAHSEQESDIREKASAMKVHNPWLQPSSTTIAFKAAAHQARDQHKKGSQMAVDEYEDHAKARMREGEVLRNVLGKEAQSPFYIWANEDCANSESDFEAAKRIRLDLIEEGCDDVYIVDADGVEVVDDEIVAHEEAIQDRPSQ